MRYHKNTYISIKKYILLYNKAQLIKKENNMSLMLRIGGTAYEQRLVGFKDEKRFKQVVKDHDDSIFYDILDENLEDTKELYHQYIIDASSTISLATNKNIEEIGVVEDLSTIPNRKAEKEDLQSKGYAFAYSIERSFFESYTLPKGVTKKNFDMDNLYCIGSKFNKDIDMDCSSNYAMTSGTLYYITMEQIKDAAIKDKALLMANDSAFDINELDSYDISDILATLIFADSSIIEKYKLEYNEDGECCDREVSGYFLDSELKRK